MTAALPHPVRPARRLTAAALAACLVLGAGACSDDDPAADEPGSVESGGGTEGEGGSGGSADSPGRPEVGSVVDLAELIEENGHTCSLEYEGLRDGDKELSICTVGGEQVTLSIWFDQDALEAFRAAPPGGSGGITVVGANWTIDLADPHLAETLAGELDADLRED